MKNIYIICNEGATIKLADLVANVPGPLYIRVDKKYDSDLYISKQPFTLAEAKTLGEQDMLNYKYW